MSTKHNNIDARQIWNKVPEITFAFWIIKILSTTVGETGADFLAVNIGFGQILTTFFMSALLLMALFLQLSGDRMIAWRYWLTVVLVSVVGTLITDILTDSLHIRLSISTLVFAVLLITCLSWWYKVEGTLSIQAINTRRRELFYWLAILLTFALGTAAGDLATEAAMMGFAHGVLFFSAAIAFVSAGYYLRLAGSVLCFWAVYILTRPLGASLGDLLTQAKTAGGLGLGTLPVSLVFLVAIILLVAKASHTAKSSNPSGEAISVAPRNLRAAIAALTIMGLSIGMLLLPPKPII